MTINTNLLLEFNMQAQLLTPPYQPVYWTVYNAPDMTGLQSGYQGQLQNIEVASVYGINSTPNLNVPVGPAYGDLSGNYPAPIVVGIDGYLIENGPTNGYVLTYNDGYLYWESVSASASLAGDVTGTLGANTVAKVQGVPVSATPPTSGQGLFYNGSDWIPTTLPSYIISPSSPTQGALLVYNTGWSNLAAGATAGTVLTSAGTGQLPTWAAAFTAAGDLSGSSSSQTVIRLQGNAVESQSLGASQDGYVLTWHNASTQWQALAASGGGGGSVNSVSGSAPIVATGSSAVTVSISAATDSTAGSMSAADKTKLDQIPATPGFYGDGSNGSATCDGTTAVTGMTRASTIYTMTQDLYFTNLTINTSVTVLGNGWRLFVSGTFTNNGSFNADGGAGQSGTSTPGTPGGSANYLGHGISGSAGGGGGNNVINSLGGAGGTSASGAGGTATAPASPISIPRSVPEAILAYSVNPSVFATSSGLVTLVGGGSGASVSADSGATGAGSGGVILVVANTLTGNGVISAKGGAGHSTATGLYGSGGGGGGFVTVVSRTSSAWTGTISAAGGAGGAGTTTAGGAGSAGTIIQLVA